MRHLLELLCPEPVYRIIDETEWEGIITLAGEHHVLPFIASRLLESNLPLPPAIEARLGRARREAIHYSFVQRSELQQLLQAFANAQIPVLPLKGPSLAERVYGDASLRISCDHDLLVYGPDFARAVRLLRALDFAPDALSDDYHQKWHRKTTIVELHFDVENPLAIDFDVRQAWRNAQQANFGGQPVWQLTLEDELRYLCLHGVRHRFNRLSLILDVALASNRLEYMRDAESKLDKRSQTMCRVLNLGCALAQRLDPKDRYRRDPSTALGSSSIERLAQRLWSDLLLNPATCQDWASMHRFYLELEATRLRRLFRRFCHMKILLYRLIDDDFAFAARFGLKRPWQVWLLRPLRLALRCVTSRKAESLRAPLQQATSVLRRSRTATSSHRKRTHV